jgi:tocopherol cyclase
MNFLKRWKATWHPDRYHGWGKSKNYFEGWYYKIVDPNEELVLAVIPGISYDAKGVAHAFIQLLDGKNNSATYHEFPESDFRPHSDYFELRLGENFFSKKEIRLAMPELQGNLRIDNPVSWPKMLGAPGIMGWYSFVPFMECYHGVVSLHHHLKGELTFKKTTYNMDGGIGYIEKDWGVSFPKSWIWLQSNHFEREEPTCIMASVAHIPWLGSFFIGYIVGFYFENKLYRFATYTGAKMKASIEGKKVHLAFKDSNNRLEITGIQAPGADLISPISGAMTGKVNESMQGKIEVRFFKNEKLVFEDTARNAGMELAGEVKSLLTEKWRR